MLSRLLPLGLLFMSLLVGQASAATSAWQPVRTVEGISEYRLPNGLQVLLVPDDSKPTTTVNMTYRVGSRQENTGETGMAHLLEHLMFKGSPKHRNVWAELTRRGLRANGSTSFDRTNYYASFAANDDNLRWYLGWQADAMLNSFIAQRDLDSEMTVVRNEMEQGENRPSRILSAQTMATMFQWHNYGRSTIGARSDVENVDIARLQAFYRLYYQPDNATLIVSGRFEPARVLGWIQESFGPLPKPQRVLPRFYTLDPAQDGERSVTLRRVGGAPMLMAAYHLPAGADPDYPATEALASILGDAPSGRLHKRLVEKQLAASVYGDTMALHDPGVGFWGAQLAPGQDIDKARDELLAVVEGIAREPVTEEELRRAQARWLKQWDQQFANPEAVGVGLSAYVALGDWRLFFLLRDRMQALTVADVQRVAQQWLLPSNRTLGTYVPTDKPQRPPAPAAVDLAVQLRDFKPQAGATAVAAFDPTPANIDALTRRFTLPSGLQAAVLPKPTRGDAVSATLTLRFGDEKSLLGQQEVGALVAELLDEGTPTLSREQIQDRLDQLKTQLSIGGGASGVVVRLNSRRQTLAPAIELLGQLLRESSFPEASLDEARRQRLSAIQQQRDEPQAVADNALARHGDPYPPGDLRHARSFDEMVADLKAVDAAQLRSFHRRFYGASNAQFAAVGDLDADAVRQALTKAFGDWRSPQPYARIAQPLVSVPGTRLLLAIPDKQNAVVRIEQALPLSDNDADYPAVMLGNFILGSGGDSRLWKRVRDREGLSYSVYSGVDWSSEEAHSTWRAGAIYAPQNRAKVELALGEEIQRALAGGFSNEEVASAKKALLAFRRLGRAQDAQLAAALSNNLYLGRTFAVSQRVDDALAALTADQVNRAMRNYLQPERFVSAFAGDFKP
jgi:zinc protease